MRPESEVTAEVVWIFPLLGTLEGACGERPWTRPLPGSVVWGTVVSLKVWREPLSSGSIPWEMFSCSVSWTALITCYLSREPKRVALPMLGTNKLKTDWAYVIFQHEGVASGLIGPLLGHDLHVMARCDVQSSGCLITRCWQAFECSAPVDPSEDPWGGCEDDDTSSDAASMYSAPGGAMTPLDAAWETVLPFSFRHLHTPCSFPAIPDSGVQ